MGNINQIIFEAFSNSSNEKLKINKDLSLKAATLDSSWKKHGTKSKSSSHVVYYDGKGNEKEIRKDFETLLFVQSTDSENLGIKGKWKMSFMSAAKNILIARIDLGSLYTDFRAVLGAVKIEDVSEDTICTVQELGYHPTLVCKGEFIPTSEITVIVELDGSKDGDLGECCQELKGKPVLATWFPGRQTPPSNPTDCKVGDTMTASEAKARGWNTVSFKN